MMAEITEDYISSVIAKVTARLNITDWKYSQQKFENVGQNYFGVLIKIVLNGKAKEQETSLSLVLKLAPTDERYRVSDAVTLMFAREIFVYSILLEQYRQQQTLTLTQYVTPMCYYVCREYYREAIAMQDMCTEGYKPYTRTMFLDCSHIKAALIVLARFHAHSFILRKRNKLIYEEAQKVCVPLTLETNKRYMDVMENRLDKAIDKFQNTIYAKKFEHLKQNKVELIEATWNSVEATCICHGDIWKENILFKYAKLEAVSACLIDYQTARVCTPAYDVLYLISSSTDSDLRRHYFREMLDIYYDEFETNLTSAGLECQEEYSRTSFEKDLKAVGPACVIVTNTALWLACGLQQEGHIRSKLTFNTDSEKAAAIQLYKNIMKHIIDDLTSYEYLNSGSKLNV